MPTRQFLRSSIVVMPSRQSMVVISAVAALLTIASVSQRPFFSSGVVATLGFGAWFVANEDREIHDSNEMDDYCIFLALLVSSTYLLNVSDSPLRKERRYNLLLPFAAPMVFNIYSRHRHRKYLEAGAEQAQAHWPKPSEGTEDRERINKCVATLRATLQVLDLKTVPTLFNAWLRYKKVLRSEKAIYETFADESLNRDALSALVLCSPLSLLLYKVKNHMPLALTWGVLLQLWRGTDSVHRTLRPSAREGMPFQNRANFIKLLTYDRLPELSTVARAVVLDSLQRVKLTTLEAETAVAHILQKTVGAELTLLKSLCDSKGTHHSLHRLVFSDIVDAETRDKLVAHFSAQMKLAKLQLSQCEVPVVLRKVLSDVDDTFVCSGGSYPAGIDTRMKKHQIYPGASAFLRSLDCSFGLFGEYWGTSGSELGNITFLSARPRVYGGALENSLFTDFSRLKDQGKFHCMPAMLAGDLETGWAYMRWGDFEPMAEKKFQNFVEYTQLYPEYSFVFVGDNGQGDLAAGARMLSRHPELCEAVFIHVVQPLQRTFGISALQSMDHAVQDRIVFFKDYVDAATAAASRGFVGLADLAAVATSARNEFEGVAFQTPAAREQARVQLNASVIAAAALWRATGIDVDPPEPLPPPAPDAETPSSKWKLGISPWKSI